MTSLWKVKVLHVVINKHDINRRWSVRGARRARRIARVGHLLAERRRPARSMGRSRRPRRRHPHDRLRVARAVPRCVRFAALRCAANFYIFEWPGSAFTSSEGLHFSFRVPSIVQVEASADAEHSTVQRTSFSLQYIFVSFRYIQLALVFLLHFFLHNMLQSNEVYCISIYVFRSDRTRIAEKYWVVGRLLRDDEEPTKYSDDETDKPKTSASSGEPTSSASGSAAAAPGSEYAGMPPLEPVDDSSLRHRETAKPQWFRTSRPDCFNQLVYS